MYPDFREDAREYQFSYVPYIFRFSCKFSYLYMFCSMLITVEEGLIVLKSWTKTILWNVFSEYRPFILIYI
jgi:hypothetical protein